MAIRPLSNNLNQTSFVNKGFIIWLSGHYPAILTKQALSIKDYYMAIRPLSNNLNQTSLVNKGFIIWLSGKFFLRNTSVSLKQAR